MDFMQVPLVVNYRSGQVVTSDLRPVRIVELSGPRQIGVLDMDDTEDQLLAEEMRRMSQNAVQTVPLQLPSIW